MLVTPSPIITDCIDTREPFQGAGSNSSYVAIVPVPVILNVALLSNIPSLSSVHVKLLPSPSPPHVPLEITCAAKADTASTSVNTKASAQRLNVFLCVHRPSFSLRIHVHYTIVLRICQYLKQKAQRNEPILPFSVQAVLYCGMSGFAFEHQTEIIGV